MTASTPLPLGAESSCWGFDDLEVAGPPAFNSQRTVGVVAGEVVDGRFEIRSSLGGGGSGAVFLALDKTLRREVALKMLWDTNLSEQGLLRFEREGVIAASLDHPGIVRVHSAGTWGGRPYIAYELVPGGQDLREAWVLLDLRRRVTLLRDAAHALGNAHARGIVHRDVKPENVLVDPSGRIRVTDFGLSWARSLGSLTRTGELFGTPVYMAPEQMLRNHKVRGSTADVWSLGVMLFEALTDELPFGGSAVEVLSRVPTQEAISPRAIDPSVPADLEAICLKCLSKDPRRRFATGETLAQALDAWLTGGPLERRPRRRAWWVAAPLAVVGVTAALLVGTQLGEDASPGSTTTAAPITPASSAGVDSEPLEVVWALALAGKPRAALERCPPSADSVRRAWLAAWAEDRAACEEALAEVTDRSQALALAWTLRAHVPDLTVPRDGRRDDAWTAIADGEEHLSRGHTWSAALAFEEARTSVCSVDVELASRLGLARVSLAQGALERATDLAKEALALTRHPLDQERVLSFMRTLADSPHEPADELRLGPHGGVWLTPARARASIRAGQADDARVFLARALADRGAAPASAEASFARAELDLCARGGDGAAGILLARAVELTASAVRGGDEEAAEDALKALKVAARFRPGSPALWIAKSQAELVDRDPEDALRAADRALRYAPGDPEALLARAHALFAHLDQAPPDEEEIEKDPGPLLYRARQARLEGRPRAGWADLRSKLLRGVDETVAAFRDARDAAPRDDQVASEARLAVARLLLERALVTGERPSISEIQRELGPLLRRIDVDGVGRGRVAPSGPFEIGRDAYLLSLRALLLMARARSARHVDAYARVLEAGRSDLLSTDDLERAARALSWAPELTDRFLSEHSGPVIVSPAGGAPLARALAGTLGRNAAQAAAASSEALAAEPGSVAAHLLRARAMSGMIRARGASEFLTRDLEHDQRCARFGLGRPDAFSAALARAPALGQVLTELQTVSTLSNEDAVDELEDAFDDVDGDLPDALKEAAESALELRKAEVGKPAKRVKRLREAAEKVLLVSLYAAPSGKAFELTHAQARGSRVGSSPAETAWIELQRLGSALRLQAEIAEALGPPAEDLRRDAALFSSGSDSAAR